MWVGARSRWIACGCVYGLQMDACGLLADAGMEVSIQAGVQDGMEVGMQYGMEVGMQAGVEAGWTLAWRLAGGGRGELLSYLVPSTLKS